MKKFIRIIMVIMVLLTISAFAEDTLYYDNRDYVWFDSIIEDFNNAFENADLELSSVVVLYDGMIYMTNSGVDATCVGYSDFSRSKIKDLEEYLTNLLIEDGACLPQVEIRFAGEREDGEDIYETTIMMMENMNEFNGEKTGSSFIEEGINYNVLKVLGPIR